MPTCRAGEGAGRRLHFELPFTGKMLLLAAYVCSYNRPALDRRLFDASARAGRRRGNMAADRQVHFTFLFFCGNVVLHAST